MIIQKQPNPSGAYPAPQSWNRNVLPDGYATIADAVDMTDFYAYNGFVTLVVTDDVVTAYQPNIQAWEEWKAQQPEPRPEPKPEPTTEERVSALEEQLAQADETAIYLFEMQAVQDEINAVQDEALIALFEMIGGEE